jgi:hypothetical protein
MKGDDVPEWDDTGGATRAQGAVLRELHAFLKEKDPGFGGLLRVQNKRREFLWVHPAAVTPPAGAKRRPDNTRPSATDR